MAEPSTPSFVAECFWPGVAEDDVRALEGRIEASVAELAGGGQPIRYAGSILMRQDEVVLCLFEGPAASVRLAAERAGIPFERIVESTHWSNPGAGGHR